MSSNIELILRITRLLTQEEKEKLYLLLTFLFFLGVTEALGIFSVLPLIALFDPDQANALLNRMPWISSSMVEAHGQEILLTIATILFVTSVSYRFFANKRLYIFIENHRARLSTTYCRTYMEQDYRCFIQREQAQMIKLTISEVDNYIGNVIRQVISMFAYGFVTIVLVSFLLLYNPQLALSALLFIGCIYLSMYRQLKAKYNHYGKVRLKANEQRFAGLTTMLASFKSIKMQHTEHHFIEKYSNAAKSFSLAQNMNQIMNLIPNLVMETALFTGFIIYFLFGHIHEAPQDAAVVTTFAVFAAAIYRIKPAINIVYNGFASLKFAEDSVATLLTEIDQTRNLEDTGRKIGPFGHIRAITAKSLCCKHTDKLILANINIGFQHGNVYGIRGESGSGKSTFLDCLAGLLEPNQGEVLFHDGDHAIRSVDYLKSRIGNVAYVCQHTSLISGTFIENIALGQDRNRIDNERLNEIVIDTGLERLISSLPNGLETVVGETGIRLSGGETQRLAIARALYTDPDFLILDEVTAGLDRPTASAILASIRAKYNNRIIILVSHTSDDFNYCDYVIDFNEVPIRAKKI